MIEMQKGSPEQDNKHLVEEALYRPVPDMDVLRERKNGYSDLPIDVKHPKFYEPVVKISDYDIAGQAYYSRPNATTGEPLGGVPPELFLRKSIAETLSKINSLLSRPVISEFFGGEVELYVEDGLRPVSLQTRLYNDLVPALLRKNNPNITDEALAERRKDIIATPSSGSNKPSPHATGGALDVILRYKQSTSLYVKDSEVPLGHVDGETGPRISPDYFEKEKPQTDEDKVAQRNRRAYYAIITGAAFGVYTGLINNPTEWWHWGRGDQLSEKVRGSSSAYYSLAETT